MTNLESRYDNLFGTKTSKGQLYGGFLLLIFGILLGIAAVVFVIMIVKPVAAAGTPSRAAAGTAARSRPGWW